MKLEDYKSLYLEKENEKKSREREVAFREEMKIESQKAHIRGLGQDISDVCDLGQFLLDHGHDLKGKEWGGQFLDAEERNHHFIADGWFHMIGFYVNRYGTIYGIGVRAGGYCGNTDLLIETDGEVSSWWQEGAEQFLDGFFRFKDRLNAYAKEVLENMQEEKRMKKNLTKEQIKDILTTAIEGGIAYWAILDNTTPEWKDARAAWCRVASEYDNSDLRPCYCDIAYEALTAGKEVIFIDAETDDVDDPNEDEIYRLTMDKFVKGCEMWEERSHKSLADAIDWCEYDADDADIIIQFALFGEIMFG